jgi:hypothetical protein
LRHQPAEHVHLDTKTDHVGGIHQRS